MFETFQRAYDYRELLMAFTIRNIKMKYKQTVFGFLWAIFLPVVILLSGLLVKLAIATLSKQPLQEVELISISVKALPWAFFIGALRFSVGSLVSNTGIIQKVYFPRVIFPLGYILSQLFDLVISSIAFCAVFLLLRLHVSAQLLWVPLILSFLILFTSGLGIALSAANLFFRDVKHIVDVMLTFAIFFTPVFVEARSIERWGIWLLLNPVGAMLESLNQAVVYGRVPEIFWLWYSALWAISMFISGWALFHKSEPLFAENI